MLDQAVHLPHAGACGDQHQRAVGQLGQMGIAKRHFDTRQTIPAQLLDQLQCAGFAGQYVQFQVTPAVRRRRKRKCRRLAAFALDHQILPCVIPQGLAGRRAQAHAPDIATDLDALAYRARQLAHRQFAERQHTVPEQHAVLQRFSDAGEQFTMVPHLAILAHAPLDQQGGANMAVAIAAAVGTVITQAPGAIEDPFPGLKRQH